jgi:hypothetical protein
MRKEARPFSQLFLFSESEEKKLELWFGSSIIEVYKNNRGILSNNYLLMVVEVLGVFKEKYPVITVVQNPKESSISLCTLSGSFSRIVYVSGVKGYEALSAYSQHVKRFSYMSSYMVSGGKKDGGENLTRNFGSEDLDLNNSINQTYTELWRCSTEHLKCLKQMLSRKFS